MSGILGSPLKGESKEENHWQPEWWQFQPLVERPERPVVWTKSSTVVFSHPTQPAIIGHLFPSSQQFRIEAPAPVLSVPTSYDPPTIITVSPSDHWMFAYFPGKDGPGISCIWTRGLQVDDWNVNEWRFFPYGGGIVSAAWLGQTREWSTDATGRAIRLPPLGPPTPGSTLTLMLVTQDLQTHIYYVRNGNPSLKIMSCSLTLPDDAHENIAHAGHEIVPSSEGVKLCVSAAIGIGYDETSIMIATRSRIITPPSVQASFQSVDLSLDLDAPFQPQESEYSQPLDWENWDEDPTIELCDVRIGFDGVGIHIATHPLPPLDSRSQQLSKMVFVTADPHTTRKPEPKEASGPVAKMYLVTSFVDFGDYSSFPKSEMVVHALARNESAQHNSRPEWLISIVASRSFTSEILTFIAPHSAFSRKSTILAGFTSDTVVPTASTKRKPELAIGDVRVLQLPALNTSDAWPPAPILGSIVHRFFQESTFNVAISPNGTLLFTVSPSPLSPSRVSIHPLPRCSPNHILGQANDTKTEIAVAGDLTALVSAIRSRRALSDIVHRLSLPSTPLREVEDILFGALSQLEDHDDGLPSIWLHDFFGALIEVYRSRASRAQNDGEKEELIARWQTALDMCSILACHSAFEDCKDGDNCDLDAVWPISRLCAWIMELLENLLKECVLQGDSGPRDGEGSRPPSIPPVFIHLLHPGVLAELRTSVADVKRFYDYLGKLKASGENAQLAKGILLDYVDSSGVNLKELQDVFSQISDELKESSRNDARRSLASCHPVASLSVPLSKIVVKISASGAIDKPRLFIKASDLITGIANMQLLDSAGKEGRDVVSKSLLLARGRTRVCLRCGGKAQQPESGNAKLMSLRWTAWENKWAARCICGGLWASSFQ